MNKGGYIKIVIFALSFLWSYVGLYSQDRTFSFYQENPILGNPARYTSFDMIRVGMHLRYQPLVENQSLSTVVLDGSIPIFPRRDSSFRASVSLGFLYDQQGQFFNTQGIMSGFAYQVGSDKLQFSWGVQGGIFWEQLSSTDLDTRSNFSFPDGYDPIASNAETSLGNQGSYLSLSAGFRLRQRLQNGREKFHLGLALRNANHLGKDGSLEDGTQIVLPYHINVSAAYRFLTLEKISPTVYSRFIRRSGFNYVQSGVFIDFRPKSRFNLNNNIRTGIWYNSNRALGAQFQIHYPNYSLRFGYEFGIGEREQVWLGNGAFEFGMTIRFKSSRVKKPAEPILPPLPMYPKSYTNFNLIKPNEPLLSPGTIDLYVPRINYLGPTYTLEPEQMQVMFSPINIPFQFGEIELSEASLQRLKPLVLQLKTYFGSKVLISGYTCNLGETKANKELSLKRALMVKEYLVRQGVNPENVRVRGLGEANPLNQNATESERKINRRVIIEPDSY